MCDRGDLLSRQLPPEENDVESAVAHSREAQDILGFVGSQRAHSSINSSSPAGCIPSSYEENWSDLVVTRGMENKELGTRVVPSGIPRSMMIRIIPPVKISASTPQMPKSFQEAPPPMSHADKTRPIDSTRLHCMHRPSATCRISSGQQTGWSVECPCLMSVCMASPPRPVPYALSAVFSFWVLH